MMEQRPDPAAVLVPGGRCGPDVALLMYAADAAAVRGAAITPISWTDPGNPGPWGTPTGNPG